MRALCLISSLGLMAASAVQPVMAEGISREEVLEQMKSMRPPDLVVLERKDVGGDYTLGIFAIKRDSANPELRKFKLWQEYSDNLLIPSESVDCSAEEPVRVTRDKEAIYIRKLNPGGPVRATAREDHLVWWAACHPELAGQQRQPDAGHLRRREQRRARDPDADDRQRDDALPGVLRPNL